MNAPRLAWFEAQLDLDPDRPVFLDETGATNMVRRHVRSWRNRVAAPYGHHKTTTVTTALRVGAVAIDLLVGTTNGIRFRAYVADTLVPGVQAG